MPVLNVTLAVAAEHWGGQYWAAACCCDQGRPASGPPRRPRQVALASWMGPRSAIPVRPRLPVRAAAGQVRKHCPRPLRPPCRCGAENGNKAVLPMFRAAVAPHRENSAFFPSSRPGRAASGAGRALESGAGRLAASSAKTAAKKDFRRRPAAPSVSTTGGRAGEVASPIPHAAALALSSGRARLSQPSPSPVFPFHRLTP